MGYIANYGYKDGSGDYFISIDTGKCNGCGKCVEACPEDAFEVILDDYDDEVAQIKVKHRKNLKYLCGPCKPVSNRPELPCVKACEEGAIQHSW